MKKSDMISTINMELAYYFNQIKKSVERNDSYWSARNYEKYSGMVMAYNSIMLIDDQTRDNLIDTALELYCGCK